MIVADTNIISYLFLPISVKLVTQDKKILREFPEIAVSLEGITA